MRTRECGGERELGRVMLSSLNKRKRKVSKFSNEI